MANDPCLGMLGLARRAGKLAFGDELVRQLCAEHKARCVLVAADAGESTAKKAALYAARVSIPCITLPHDKETLGAAIGKNGCAVCALSDIGMAAAAIGKLAAQHPEYAAVAAQLDEKNVRIQSRKGKKKPRSRDAQPTAEKPSASAREKRKPEQRKRTVSPRSTTGKRQTSPALQRKPSENKRAKRVSNRKSPRRGAER